MTTLVVGEALIDVLVRDGRVEQRPGGSPANVAVGLGRLGCDVTLLTACGADAGGRLLNDHLARSQVKVHTTLLSRTSTATATVDERGGVKYDLDVAWDLGTVASSVACEPTWLHVGSLAATLPPGAEKVRSLVLQHVGRAVVSYDPNIRPSAMTEDDKDRIWALVTCADVVKLSEDDAAWLRPDVPVSELARELLAAGPELVVVTLGGAGAFAATRGDIDPVIISAADGAAVVDTVGAGDAFMAGLISALADGDLSDRDLVVNALSRAMLIARRTCEKAGADPPWKETLP